MAEHDVDMAAVKGEDLDVFFTANLGRLVVLLASRSLGSACATVNQDWSHVMERDPGALGGAAWKCRNPFLRG